MKTINELLLTQNKLDIPKKLGIISLIKGALMSFLMFPGCILVISMLWSIHTLLKMKLALFSILYTVQLVLANV